MINVKTFRFDSKDRLDDTINEFAKDHTIVDVKLNTHIIDDIHPTRPATYIALVIYTVGA